MKENQTTKYRIQIDSDLLAYLNPESGEKCTKMAAFRNLVEIAIGNKKEFPAIAKPLPEGQVALTVSGLAKHWNWHRTTVRKFLSTLEETNAVKVIGRSGYFILTVTCVVLDGENSQAPLLSEEELLLNHWLCGYLTIENRWRCLHTSSPKRINYLFQNRQTNAPDDKHPPVNACTS